MLNSSLIILKRKIFLHIYIHIPFCTSKCPYCAFGSYTDSFKKQKLYFDALKFEIEHFITQNSNLKISTIFIGGGTPSAILAEYYYDIFEILTLFFRKNIEITTEANPNSASLKWLSMMRNLGVNRISFGAQSFDEKKLNFLGRNHSERDIFNAVQNAKIVGFANINVDIIYASKFDTKKALEREIFALEKLKIQHVSAYSLTLEENTPFFGKFNFTKSSVNLARFLFKSLGEIGFKQYEISNFGKTCSHNLAYWKQLDYVGFGAHSVGFSKNKRFYAPSNLDQYIANPLQKNIENLSKKDLNIERIFLGARSIVGIKANLLNEKELENAKFLLKKGKLTLKNGKFYNPNFLLADEIALFITSQF